MPAIVLLTGAPGTGKSTLADVAADALGAAVFGWDWVMASMTGLEDVQATFRAMDRERYRSVGWSIMWNLTVAQLRSGRSAVLDGVAREAEIARMREVAAEHDVDSFLVWTECSDAGIHRSRVEGRVRAIPGWHELAWSHVDALRASLEPPDEADLHLDAAEPLDANAARLRSLLAR